MAIQTYTITLQWANMIAPGVRHLAFMRDDGTAVSFIPGQFVTIHLPHEDKILRRSYSLASLPDQSNLIEFAASYVKEGRATDVLFNLQPGQQLTVSGPAGKLILGGEHPKRYVLIATGTGITPYRTMLPTLANLLQAGHIEEAVVLQGVQTRKDLLYGDDFLALQAKQPSFQFHAHYSRQALNGDARPHEREGYVQTAFTALNLDPTRDMIYLCGNPNMIDEAFTLLKEQGFDTHNIRREKYISSK